MAEIAVDVFVELGGVDVLAGRLWSHRRHRTESATFSYSADYLSHPDAYALDPHLGLHEGQQQSPVDRPMFGAFTDCAPDRWGRRLKERDEAMRAGREGGAERSFGEIDYLLGVRDDLRQGALRFRDPRSGAFLADESDGVPPLLDLPVLLSAADHLERGSANEEDLRILLRGGSSLGGARPKAHVLAQDGRVAIAKFPSPSNDKWDVMRWERVAMRVAELAGIDVPRSEIHVVDGRPVLIVDRFDRVGHRRVAYVSAMTMLQGTDGGRGSYLEIAEVIESDSPQATDDLHELWRRIAFSILISNTDDHLRNHGFLRSSTSGWSLSPAFDLNPDPQPGPRRLSTAITYEAADARVDLLMDVAERFRLDESEARSSLGEVVHGVGQWRAMAEREGLDSESIERMRPAFEHDQAAEAKTLATVS